MRIIWPTMQYIYEVAGGNNAQNCVAFAGDAAALAVPDDRTA